MTSSAVPSSEDSAASSPSGDSAGPIFSRRSRSTTVWASIPLIAWGAQVAGATMSYGFVNGSNESAQDYEHRLASSVDLGLPATMNGVILILAGIGTLTAIYLAVADRAVGAAALSMVLAGISLSVSLTYLAMTGTPGPVIWYDGLHLVNVPPAVVLLASAVTLNRHMSTPEAAR